jgi:selenocysteine lyase/cysteine desulfurase
VIDVDALRADTPGVAEVIHFNNAGSALMPQPVVDTIRDYLDLEVRCGGYEARDDCADEIDEVYTSIGRLINALPSEIALADNATRAWDMAFYGLELGAGDRILTTSTEYVSNWAAYLHLRDTRGVVVDVVEDSPTGEIDLEELDRAVDGTVKLITLNHVPTNSGLVNPAHEVGVIARNHGVPFLLDACQSVGHLPVDVESIGCDMLSATSRKYLRGPRGQGFLYVRDTMLDRVRPPFVELESASVVSPDRYELRSSARRFETWEKNFANVLGLGAAVDYALAVGIDSIWDRIRHLAIALRSGLAGVDGVTLRDIGRLQCGIVTFEVDDHDPEAIKQTLRGQSINVSTSTASSSPIDMHRRGIDRLVRASVHAYNSEEEIESFVRAIARLR